VNFKIVKYFPPNREGDVAELNVDHNGTLVDIPAEVFREEGELRIRIFPPTEAAARQYTLDEWLEAIQRAVEVLGPEG
jgi:hypothetical protein